MLKIFLFKAFANIRLSIDQIHNGLFKTVAFFIADKAGITAVRAPVMDVQVIHGIAVFYKQRMLPVFQVGHLLPEAAGGAASRF